MEKKWEKIQTAKEYNPLYYKVDCFDDLFVSNNCSSIYMINISLNYMTMFWTAYTYPPPHTE